MYYEIIKILILVRTEFNNILDNNFYQIFCLSETTTNPENTTSEPNETTTASPNDFEAQIISREQWGAGELNSLLVQNLSMPIKRIIIAHTRGQFCVNEVS